MDDNLDDYEREIVEMIESGKTQTIENFEVWKKIFQKAVHDQLERMRKDTRITIRLNSYVLEKVKYKARKKGLPYQTYISSVLTEIADKED